LKPRRFDFVFARPFVLDVSYIIHPPIGYVVRNLPADERLELGTVTLTSTFAVVDEQTVTAKYRLDSGPRRLTPAQFEEVRKAVNRIQDQPAFLFYFDQIGRKYLDAGDVGKAVAEFRRLAAMHPKEGSHRAEVASALLAGGLGAAARREARAATELDPKSARAYSTLGAVLTTDLIGRDFMSGSDVKGAIAAYRKAKQLAPTDVGIRAQLALVLQYSDAGLRYENAERVDEAIAEYVELKKLDDVNQEYVDRELMSLYARRGKWTELTKLLAETKDTQLRDVYKVVAAGGSGNAAAAVAASNLIELSTRRSVQSQAGALLAAMRQYPPAAELFSAAAQGASNAAQLRTQADLLRKIVRSEDIRIDTSKPESMLRMVLLEFFKGASEEDIARRYTTTDGAAIFNGTGLREKKHDARSGKVKKAMRRKDADSLFVADIALSAFEVQVDGDEAVGLRLRGRIPGGGADSQMDLYLVKENGAYKFAGDNKNPHELGLRAFRHAEKNELVAARQWLDWAREHVSGGSDDPVGSEPFTGVWSRGRQGTLDEVRLAAATLLPETRRSSELALPVLLAARESAPADVQWRIDQALVRAYTAMEKWPEMLAASQRLIEKFPDSGIAFLGARQALLELDRRDEANSMAVERLSRIPGDVSALRALGSDALSHDRYGDALKYFSQVLERSKPSAGDYNNHAWASIFARASLDAARETARQATEQAPTEHAVFNTLAVVYAEQGNSAEARETLLKGLDQSSSDDLTPDDWYVVGRIAENYGILDAAGEAYRKIEKPKVESGTSWTLAQQRLAGMKK
jgi:tetratricopeptide (TPR) repeat protein